MTTHSATVRRGWAVSDVRPDCNGHPPFRAIARWLCPAGEPGASYVHFADGATVAEAKAAVLAKAGQDRNWPGIAHA